MKTKKATKAECIALANEIAEMVAKRLNITKPKVRWERGEAVFGTDFRDNPKITASVPSGEIEISGWADKDTCGVCIRYTGPMDDAKRAVARHVGGNAISGKLNWTEWTREATRPEKVAIANLSAHLRGVAR